MIQPGQTYRSADPSSGPRIRITYLYDSGPNPHVHAVNADTPNGFRQIPVEDLHATATTRDGAPRRTGYVQETT
ncbi:hypothetical protein [Streptomyces anulatus]|uniref:hypothetical protein n=1 Tax=Streptomyces anulatus TaxID=1892 RepID=UPI00386A139F|nr:hypothetical protein OG575_05740 [Streptomyces anulatus]